MPSSIEYTSRARKLAYRLPKFSYIIIQINFWIVAFILYSTITHLNTLYLKEIGSTNFPLSYSLVIVNSVFMGIMFGAIIGIADILIDRIGLRKLSVGLIILFRVIAYPVVLMIMLGITRYVISVPINEHFGNIYTELIGNELTWRFLYRSLLIYTAFMAAVISFINQMNYKFGPGILIPLLLGRYRKPKEQERFFMFIDLKSSTKHAEDLGHLEYSSMIRDCFQDLNHVLFQNIAEIYQYVGDEAVVTWPVEEGVKNLRCLSLFYDFKERLISRQDYYFKNYGFVPEFKAGLHLGIITVVEVGEIKREIAYHGDTINTAARIQSMCNRFGKEFLISDSVRAVVPDNYTQYLFNSLRKVSLKGKDKAVELFGVVKNQV